MYELFIKLLKGLAKKTGTVLDDLAVRLLELGINDDEAMGYIQEILGIFEANRIAVVPSASVSNTLALAEEPAKQLACIVNDRQDVKLGAIDWQKLIETLLQIWTIIAPFILTDE